MSISTGLKEIIKTFNFSKSKFLKNASILILGSSFSQFISIVTAPLITRLYTPGDYGLLGIYMMVSTIIGVVSTLQYHTAIVVEKDDLIAYKLVWICFRICFIISSIIAIAVILFNEEASYLLGDKNLSSWLYFMPVTVLLVGFSNTLLCWTNRQSMFKVMASSRIYTAIAAPLFSIPIGYFVPGPLGLFVGLLTSQVLAIFFLGRGFWGLAKNDNAKYSKKNRTILKEHSSFLRFSMPGELINTFVNQLPIFVLAKYFSTDVVGQYNLGNRLLSVPSQIISQSVGEVFRQKASEEYNATGSCRKIFLKTFFSLGAVSLFPFLILIIWSPEIFSFFFGENWALAGKFVRILSIIYILRFMISPLTFVCFIVRKNYISLIGTIYYAISSLILVVILVKLQSDIFTLLWAYTLNFASLYLVMLLVNYRFSKGSK